MAPGGRGELSSRKRETVIDAKLTFPKHVTVLADRGGFAYIVHLHEVEHVAKESPSQHYGPRASVKTYTPFSLRLTGRNNEPRPPNTTADSDR